MSYIRLLYVRCLNYWTTRSAANKTVQRLKSESNHRPLRRSQTSDQRIGAALVEFAFVAPIMILFTVGLIEIGRMTMVKSMLLNASRDGARLASLQGSTNDAVTASVQQSVNSMALNSSQITVSPFPLSSTPAGSNVQVTISVSANAISWLPAPLFTAGKTVSASTSMRRESP